VAFKKFDISSAASDAIQAEILRFVNGDEDGDVFLSNEGRLPDLSMEMPRTSLQQSTSQHPLVMPSNELLSTHEKKAAYKRKKRSKKRSGVASAASVSQPFVSFTRTPIATIATLPKATILDIQVEDLPIANGAWVGKPCGGDSGGIRIHSELINEGYTYYPWNGS
jgi:hypothetical protein